MRGEFLDLAGHRLYYYAAGTRGAGEPVMLLHGFPASSYLWTNVVRCMPDGYRLIVLDQLGSGRSDRPDGESLAVSSHAARAIAVLDTLQVPQACIVGHGLGGAVAQWMAVHWPERVTRLALVSSVGRTAWPRWSTRVARALLPIWRMLPASLLAGQAYAELLRGFEDRDEGRHALDQFLRPFAQPLGRAPLLAHLDAMRHDETAALDLSAVRAPTSILHGARDPFVPVSLARELHRAIPGATLEIAAEGRHFLPLDAPDRVAASVGALLKR